jgi:hypothetical protein
MISEEVQGDEEWDKKPAEKVVSAGWDQSDLSDYSLIL